MGSTVASLPSRPSSLLALISLSAVSHSFAVLFANPWDAIRARVQITGVSPRGVARELLRAEGWRGFWRGLTPALLRETVYSGVRLGLYERVRDTLSRAAPNVHPVALRLLAGATCGVLGSVMSNPLDLLKTRAFARPLNAPDTTFASDLRGVVARGTVMRGVGPSATRAAVVTATQLGSYDTFKGALKRHGVGEGIQLHVLSASAAAVVAIAASSPFDVAKTLVMAAETGGPVAALRGAVRAGGARALFRGATPSWVRLGVMTLVSLSVFEQLRSAAGLAPM